MENQKHIVFAGTRGIPANYGGFETAVEELSRRFVKAGYACDVICRHSHSKIGLVEYEGCRLVYVKGSSKPKLETFVSAIQAGWFLFRHRHDYDHVFWFNNANFPGILLTLLAGIPVSVNTDGLEWRRKKWSWPFKAYYFLVSWLISRLVPRLISDSFEIQNYYRKVFRSESIVIPYGVPSPPTMTQNEQTAVLDSFNLSAGRYFLQITRFEPDNLPLEIAQGFLKSGLVEQGYCFVVVGFRSNTPYALSLKSLSGQERAIRVLPAIYDSRVLYALRTNSFAYLHGNSVGGTNPALLEAMVSCRRIMAVDVPFNREVLNGTGICFDPKQITSAFRQIITEPSQIAQFIARAKWYDWDRVADSYQKIADGQLAVYDAGK